MSEFEKLEPLKKIQKKKNSQMAMKPISLTKR